MGCGTIKVSETSKFIDVQLKQDRRNQTTKILCLGAGDSGKSTFSRQLKVLYQTGFSRPELVKYAGVLKDNTISSMKTIIEEAKNREISIPKKLKRHVEKIINATELLPEHATDIKLLWASNFAQAVWLQRNEFIIPSTADYYFDHVERISKEDFRPVPEDVFRAKIKTTGIVETYFTSGNKNFLLIDVGGQRNERRKWIHSFEGVSAVIFLAALDEYDMVTAEDQKTNRLLEALHLFQEITASIHLKTSSWVLFLNKVDLFSAKFPKNGKCLTNIFPDYRGGNDIKAGLDFIQTQFEKVFKGEGTLHAHITCALDTTSVQKIFSVVEENVLVRNLTATYFT